MNRELLDNTVFITCKFAARQPGGMFASAFGARGGRGGRPFWRGRGSFPTRGGPPRDHYGLGFRAPASAPGADAPDETDQYV